MLTISLMYSCCYGLIPTAHCMWRCSDHAFFPVVASSQAVLKGAEVKQRTLRPNLGLLIFVFTRKLLLFFFFNAQILMWVVGTKYRKYDKSWLSLIAQLVKNPPAMQETQVQSLGWEDPPEKEKASHSSVLAWRIPWTVQSTESPRVWHDAGTLMLDLAF